MKSIKRLNKNYNCGTAVCRNIMSYAQLCWLIASFYPRNFSSYSFAKVYERLIKYFNRMFTKFELRGSYNSFPKLT